MHMHTHACAVTLPSSRVRSEADLAGLRKEMQAQSDKEKQAQSDMHAEARLSIPQGLESVSNDSLCSNLVAWADMATADSASSATIGCLVRLGKGACAMRIRLRTFFFISHLQRQWSALSVIYSINDVSLGKTGSVFLLASFSLFEVL